VLSIRRLAVMDLSIAANETPVFAHCLAMPVNVEEILESRRKNTIEDGV